MIGECENASIWFDVAKNKEDPILDDEIPFEAADEQELISEELQVLADVTLANTAIDLNDIPPCPNCASDMYSLDMLHSHMKECDY